MKDRVTTWAMCACREHWGERWLLARKISDRIGNTPTGTTLDRAWSFECRAHVRDAANRERIVKSVAHRLARKYSDRVAVCVDKPAKITDNQWEAVTLRARGMTLKQIGLSLGVSGAAISSRVKNVNKTAKRNEME